MPINKYLAGSYNRSKHYAPHSGKFLFWNGMVHRQFMYVANLLQKCLNLAEIRRFSSSFYSISTLIIDGEWGARKVIAVSAEAPSSNYIHIRESSNCCLIILIIKYTIRRLCVLVEKYVIQH